MKYLIFIVPLLMLFSCAKTEEKKTSLYPEKAAEKQTPEQLGKEIFEDKGNCVACHQPSQKIVGPSTESIAKIYKEKNGSIVSFLKDESDPLVDPSQYSVMKANFAITKNMSDEELKALETYIYSHLK